MTKRFLVVGALLTVACAVVCARGGRALAADDRTPDATPEKDGGKDRDKDLVDLQGAKEAFEAAQTAFVREQYDVAAEKFLAAFEHKPYPAFLFNAAVSLEKGRQFDRAKE